MFITAQGEINFMLRQMREIEASTCIRFVQRTTHAHWIDVIDDNGWCWSWIGRIGGRQELSMGRPWCFWGATMSHELFHALGYDHMHNHVNRDNFVQVLWTNIDQAQRFNFNIVNSNNFGNFNTPYDLRSIMHYPRWGFANANTDSIVPHDRSYIDVIGMGDHLSSGDVTRLNRMYECIL